MNTYVAIDQIWSYNFIGGLKETVDINMAFLDKVYSLASRFIIHRHNFYLTHNGPMYNTVVATIYNEAERAGIPQSYFQFYMDALFRKINFSLNRIQGMFDSITPVCNGLGDMIGFVIGSKLH